MELQSKEERDKTRIRKGKERLEMKVIISDHSREKIYHHIGCPHVKRITAQHRMDITIGWANVHGYRKCKCCCNLKGTIRALTNSLEVLGAGRDMEITYQPVTDTLYMRTANGFWKTFWYKDQGLLLYHLNCYDASKKNVRFDI